MKKQLIILLMSMLLAAPACLAQLTSEADVKAIKKAIADETDGYFNRNRDQWENAWVREPYIQWSAHSNNGQVLLANGWEEYSQQRAGNFAKPRPDSEAVIQRDNYQVNVMDNAATAMFLQTLELGNYNRKSRESAGTGKAGRCLEISVRKFQ